MALDEPKEHDHVHEEDGLRFVVEKKLLEENGALKLDYASGPFQKGFQITSEAQRTCDS